MAMEPQVSLEPYILGYFSEQLFIRILASPHKIHLSMHVCLLYDAQSQGSISKTQKSSSGTLGTWWENFHFDCNWVTFSFY